MTTMTMAKCPQCGKYSVPGPANCEHCGASMRGASRLEVDGAATPPPTPTGQSAPGHVPIITSRVIVTDFDMPIGSMVMFMLKWALASIPALIVLGVVGMVLVSVFAAVIGIGSMVRP